MRELIEEFLADAETEALFLDGYDDAIVGITSETEPRVVYDESLIIQTLIAEGCSEEEAWDHYGFNIQGSLQPHDHRYPVIVDFSLGR